MKPCRKCGAIRRLPSGPCLPCSVKKTKEWTLRNPERARENSRRRSRAWASRHPERAKQANSDYRLRNLEKVYGRWLKWAYGISYPDYEAMLQRQNYRCAACHDLPKQGRHLNLDHDHATGKVRWLLCQGCNMAIGAVRDDPVRLRALADLLDGGEQTYKIDHTVAVAETPGHARRAVVIRAWRSPDTITSEKTISQLKRALAAKGVTG